MGMKPKPSAELLAVWTPLLSAAAEAERQARKVLKQAQEGLRVVVVDAFDAGLTVDPISEATDKSIGRLYQMKRGVRR